MSRREQNHCKQILKYMEENEFITNDIAVEKLRCYRLAARIFDLRIHGYDIQTEMVYSVDDDGYPMKYAKYKKVS